MDSINKLLGETYWSELDGYLSEVFSQRSPLYFNYVNIPNSNKKAELRNSIVNCLINKSWITFNNSKGVVESIPLNHSEALKIVSLDLDEVREILIGNLIHFNPRIDKSKIKELMVENNLELIYQEVLNAPDFSGDFS